VATGNYAGAIPLLEEAIEMARKLGHRFRVADDLTAVGRARVMTGDLDGARRDLREGLEPLVEDENQPLIVTGLFFFAAMATAEGRHERAARLWGAGEELRASIGGAPAAGRRRGPEKCFVQAWSLRPPYTPLIPVESLGRRDGRRLRCHSRDWRGVASPPSPWSLSSAARRFSHSRN
jgi:tetratricopeptide (TPR) repeat protein